jgi:diaminohydroxyphosphoribosylaminopyrimidine deaminase/5-amino-6-(5-phosphoribosylamino)uracil reductase
MVGSQTILKDDPSLDTRLPEQIGRIGRNPLRIIVDSQGLIPLDARALRGAEDPGVILATTSRIGRDRQTTFEALGVQVLQLDGPDGRVDLPALVGELGSRGVDSVMLEGGGTLNAAFLQAGLVDKLMLFMAPKLIGGTQAISCVAGQGAECLAQAIAIDRMSIRSCGEDWLIEGYPG